MIANPILLQRKYSRVVALFAEKCGLTLDEALRFFYESKEYKLLSEGVADLHCMSDEYIAEDICIEYNSIDREGISSDTSATMEEFKGKQQT